MLGLFVRSAWLLGETRIPPSAEEKSFSFLVDPQLSDREDDKHPIHKFTKMTSQKLNKKLMKPVETRRSPVYLPWALLHICKYNNAFLFIYFFAGSANVLCFCTASQSSIISLRGCVAAP